MTKTIDQIVAGIPRRFSRRGFSLRSGLDATLARTSDRNAQLDALVAKIPRHSRDEGPGGSLSEAERRSAGRVGSEHREEEPEGVFLEPGERKYPVKEKRDGEWKYDRGLLVAAAREARMHGHEDLAKRADAIREKEFGGVADKLARALDGIPDRRPARRAADQLRGRLGLRDDIAEPISKAKLLKKLRDGDWETSVDVEPAVAARRAIEVHEAETGKKFWVRVEDGNSTRLDAALAGIPRRVRDADRVTVKYGVRQLSGGKWGIHVKVFRNGSLETEDLNSTPWPSREVALERAKRSAEGEAEREGGKVVGEL